MDKRLTSLYHWVLIVELPALERLARVEGFRMFGGDSVQREPVTIDQAAQRLDRLPRTVRTWASRYHARLLVKIGTASYYDWLDLATISRCLHLGEKVPATPEARDELREALKPAA